MDSKWIIGLNVKCETVNFMAGNIREIVTDLGYGDNFLSSTTKAQFMKGIIHKPNCIKIEKFCTVKRQC